MKKKRFKYNGFTYKVEISSPENGYVEFKCDYPCQYIKPDILYQYCNLEANHIDALEKSYLYSRHPDELNDFFDCSYSLLNYSNIDIEKIIEDLKSFGIKEKLISENQNNHDILRSNHLILHHLKRFGKIGIISMTEEFRNIPLWSYYSKNTGFAIGFDVLKLGSLRDLYGPFPINYTKNIFKIDVSKYHEALCFFYQTNMKFDKWKHEEEWRYFSFNDSNSSYDPYYNPQEKESRKFKYNDPNFIKEIILAYSFYNQNNIIQVDKQRKETYIRINQKDCDDYLRFRLIELIIERKIPCYKLVRNSDKYKLSRQKISFEEIGFNRYRVTLEDVVDIP
jgi:hypothetical protein